MSASAEAQILCGDAGEVLVALPDASVHCVVTSPPYWGLRDYGQDGQLGLERTPEEYVENLMSVFREVRRVLRDDGTVWLNLGDSYAGSGMTGGTNSLEASPRRVARMFHGNRCVPEGLKPKDLVGIPWRVAFALQADGWWLRSDIIWAKPNPMPESVRDRPTRAHEYIFLLSKSARYWYDGDAIAEPANARNHHDYTGGPADGRLKQDNAGTRRYTGFNKRYFSQDCPATRNKRTVWTVTTQPYPEAHFATFPEKLIEPCVLAGCPENGTVLDPFCGSGTVGIVALRAGRRFIGIDLNPEYCEMARRRIEGDAPLFNKAAVLPNPSPQRTLVSGMTDCGRLE